MAVAQDTSDETVELVGQLDEGPAGYVRLFEEETRDGRYVDVKVKDVVRLFPDDAADTADTAAGRTVVAVGDGAVLLICEAVQAGTLPEVSELEAEFTPPGGQKKPGKRGKKDRDNGWPRR